jgi:Phosphotransferase enzyme family
MARTVSALVTSGQEYLGGVGPFAVGVAWWSEVEQVAALLTEVLGVPVLVLRLVRVDGGAGARDGHVTYHVEALRRPDLGRLDQRPVDAEALTGPDELRARWATATGVRELLCWATEALAARGRPLTGPVEQRRTWNLAGLFRLPTAGGPVWLKATPSFAADEAAAITALAGTDPSLVPGIVAAGEHRILLEHLPGADCWNVAPEIIDSAVHRFVAAQATLADRTGALPAGCFRDRRGDVLSEQVGALLDGPLDSTASGGLTGEEWRSAHRVLARWRKLADCGLPDTLVHGDFHSGNWRSTPTGPPAVLDFADSHLGNPVLDGLRLCEFLPRDRRTAAAASWVRAWRSRVPGADPARALLLAEPLAHLAYAVRYQEFLDGIEATERIYHRDDPVESVRAALRCARSPGRHLLDG